MVKKYKKTKKTKKYSKKTKVMKGGANGKYKGPDPHIRYGAPPTTKYVAPPPTTKYGEGPTKYVEATPPKWIKSGENWVKNPAAEVMIKPTPPIVAETAIPVIESISLPVAGSTLNIFISCAALSVIPANTVTKFWSLFNISSAIYYI